MKKTILTLTLLFVAISAIFADANYQTRKNCWGFLSWRYKAYANLTKTSTSPLLWADGSGSSNSCNNTDISKLGYSVPSSGSGATTTGAKAYAKAANIGSTSWVNIYTGYSGMFAGGGNTDMQIPNLSFAPMYENEGETPINMEGSFARVGTNTIDFNEDNHSVVIRGINSRLGVDDIDIANGYSTFKIWILNASGVKDESDAKVITTMQAFILNGQLVLLGGLQASDFTQEGGKAIYDLANLDKTIAIDANINLDDVIVKVGSDVGNLGQGINEDYSINFNSNKFANNVNEIAENTFLKLNISGNPSTENLKFTVSNGTKEYSNSIISIFGNDGKLIRQIYNGELSNNNKEFNVDISSLSVGNYYLTVKTNTNEKFTRKFIKQ